MHWVYLLLASVLSLAGLCGWFLGIRMAWRHPRGFDTDACDCGYCRRGMDRAARCPECGETVLSAKRLSRSSVSIGLLIGAFAACISCFTTIFLRYRVFEDGMTISDDLWYHPIMFSSVIGIVFFACGVLATKYSPHDLILIAIGLVVSACVASFLWTRADLSVLGLPDNEGQVFYAGRGMQLIGVPPILGLGFYATTRWIARRSFA